MARFVRNPDFAKLLIAAVGDGLEAIAIGLQGDVIQMASKPGRGRYYARDAKAKKRGNFIGELSESQAKQLFAEAQNRKRPAKSLRQAGVHQASAPGDPPAIDSGNYKDSIQTDISRSEASPQEVRVGTKLMVGGKSLGRILEYGGRKIAARPHWQPVLLTGGPKALKRFEYAAKRRIRLGA